MLLLFFLFVHVHVRTRLLPAVLKFSFSKLRQSHTPNKPHNTKKNTKNKPSYIAVEFAGIFRGLGADPFGGQTLFREWDDGSNSMDNALRRVDAAFEFMTKLGA